MTDVAVVRTGTANTASVLAGLRRVGATPRLTEDPEEVRGAARLVLPGVGAFAAAMEHLHETGLVQPLRERLGTASDAPGDAGVPAPGGGGAGAPVGPRTLAICLGLQLLGSGSEESPGVEGLGVVDAVATRFPPGLAVPQLGWNAVTARPGCRWLRDGHAYFANSYRLERVPPGTVGATAEHGAPFVAAFERGGLLACQFHPELSGTFGRDLLAVWLDGGAPC